MAEPQRGVGDHVVGHAVDVGRRGRREEPEALASHQATFGRPAGRPRSSRRETQVDPDPSSRGWSVPASPPAAPTGHGVAVAVQAERERAPVGDDDHGIHAGTLSPVRRAGSSAGLAPPSLAEAQVGSVGPRRAMGAGPALPRAPLGPAAAVRPGGGCGATRTPRSTCPTEPGPQMRATSTSSPISTP